MKYSHRKRLIRRWALLISLGLIVFLVLFFRQNIELMRKGRGGVGLKCDIAKKFSFSGEDTLKEWEEKVFKNRVVYKIEKSEDLSYVRATSNNAASALYYKIDLDAKSRRPVVAWRWRVEKFPTKKNPESLEAENEDDFAARVYVIFPAMFITNSKVLEYVWSETLPVGTTGTSPYSKNIKLIVLEQGLPKDKEWFTEKRDVYEDYIKLFGRPPEYNLGAVAFMTNTEHTGTLADAMYDEIETGYKE
ncbi:MAG: DUF3047 domain-containing protein [Candidatus Omnitrophica bacterium]|nr:DUF3047 domain-containing protein [Candidatus Omnitrophota bacterium]MDD5436344.1 DUF3047 domain-containing protein [Candidatus Omnitrophota bacterium]